MGRGFGGEVAEVGHNDPHRQMVTVLQEVDKLDVS